MRADVAAAEPAVVGERVAASRPRGPSSRGTRSGRAAGSRPTAASRRTSTPGSGKPTVPGAALAVVRVRHVHDRLGHAVALEHADPGAGRELVVQRRRERRRARHAQAEAGELGDARALAARRAYIVGTPKKSVASWSRAASSTASASKRGSSTADAPHSNVPCSPTPRPCTWKSGSASTRRSCVGPAPREPQRLAARERVAVGEHRALRRAGGARRVAEQRDVVGPAGVERRRRRRRAARPRPSSTTHAGGHGARRTGRTPIGVDDAQRRARSRRRCGRSRARGTRRSPARPRARAAARPRARRRAPTEVAALITIRSPAREAGAGEAPGDPRGTGASSSRVRRPSRASSCTAGASGRRGPVRGPRRRQAAPGEEVDRRRDRRRAGGGGPTPGSRRRSRRGGYRAAASSGP